MSEELSESGRVRTQTAVESRRDSVTQVGAAIRQVRREGKKAALVHAITEATLAGLLTNFLLETTGSPVEREVRLVAVAGVTLVAFGLGYWLRVRRPLVERFERVNPPVHESLRTARDVQARGEKGPMASALYADVLARLRDTSSRRLVNSRRLAVSLVLLFALSLLTAHATVIGLDVSDFDVSTSVGGGGGGGESGGSGSDAPPSESGDGDEQLRDGSLVLGEPEDVQAGSEEVPVSVDVGSGGSGTEERAYNTGGFDSDTSVEAQRAGYAPGEVLEDADLIREYNLQIREDDD
ncbi:DUF7502 family protein [Halogranum rubrum]|uniref:Uncharacterized protein n=1 Tax=Halogranum salarium B-1 TaxID=1210908 RepID=J3ET29_9EURY|nr:hypothetical protein [Halogranum salarium]EJN57177.1 hypothetical protein HSB1_45630 [Halogranum salarium B-1]